MIFLGGIVDLPLQVALISSVPPSFHYGGQGARNLPSSLTLLPRHSERSEEACIYSVTSAAGKLVLVALWPTGITAQRGAFIFCSPSDQLYQRSEEACISCSVADRYTSAAGSFVFERGGL
jgi:hypothetical protein